jgi:hypothetical protein
VLYLGFAVGEGSAERRGTGEDEPTCNEGGLWRGACYGVG